MRTIAELKKIFWCIEANFMFDDGMYVLENRHKIILDNNEKSYYSRIYSTSKNIADSSDPDDGFKEFLKLYYRTIRYSK